MLYILVYLVFRNSNKKFEIFLKYSIFRYFRKISNFLAEFQKIKNTKKRAWNSAPFCFLHFWSNWSNKKVFVHGDIFLSVWGSSVRGSSALTALTPFGGGIYLERVEGHAHAKEWHAHFKMEWSLDSTKEQRQGEERTEAPNTSDQSLRDILTPK